MTEFKVTGQIKEIKEPKSGTSKAGTDWVKQEFVVDSAEQYNNIYCFEVFGQERVDKFNQYNKEGDHVEVLFNVSVNEWEGKHFTSLAAWMIKKVDSEAKELKEINAVQDITEPDGLPF